MAKSSINILQEYAVSNYLPVPKYEITDVSPSIKSPRFDVTVKVGKISCSAHALNKKHAKEACARNALIELGLLPHSPKEPIADVSKIQEPIADMESKVTDIKECELINFNAVGKLNEYASKNKLPYPTYSSAGSIEKGLVIINCELGQVVGGGLGPTNKAAKQSAAAALLKKLSANQSVIKSEDPVPQKIPILSGDQVDSTTASTADATEINIKSDVNTECDDSIVKNTPEKNTEVDNSKEKIKNILVLEELHEEKSEVKIEVEKEEDILEKFRIKLSKLGLEDNSNLTVIVNSTNSRIITYKNEDCHLNIVKISYNLGKTLGDIYEDIRERVQS